MTCIYGFHIGTWGFMSLNLGINKISEEAKEWHISQVNLHCPLAFNVEALPLDSSWIFYSKLHFWPAQLFVAALFHGLFGTLGSCLLWRTEHQNKMKGKALLPSTPVFKVNLAFFTSNIQFKYHSQPPLPTHISPAHIFKAFLDLQICKSSEICA